MVPRDSTTDAAAALAGSRRQFLAGAGSGMVAVLAGCLGSNPGSDGGDEAVVDDLGTLELTLTGEGSTPTRARVPTAATVTLQVRNESDQRHVVVGSHPGVPRLSVDPDTVQNESWEVPAEPGTVTVRCATHDEPLVTVTVEPMGASGGCPTG